MRFPRCVLQIPKCRLLIRSNSSGAAQFRVIPSPNYSKLAKHTEFKYNDQTIVFDNLFLRDSCCCNKCVHPSNDQKLFATGELDPNISPKSITVTPPGGLEVLWTDNHLSCYPLHFLLDYNSEEGQKKVRFMDREPVLWDGQIFSKQGFNWTDYQDYMISDKALYKILCQLKDYGLVFLRGMPDSETAVEDLANRIDRVRDTFYGKTWNVRAIAQSKNIAYTNLNLGLHMDLLYFSSPPTYQILHCLRNKAQGGSSYFVDAFKTAQDIKITSPGLYDSLCTNHVSYHYRNDGQHYYHAHPTIQLSLTSKQVQHINYSPPFQAPFDMPSQTPEFQVFMSALNKFCAYTDRKEEQFELQLKEGDCVIFNNRRVLHARREFSGNGERWLKGAYFDEDGFLSKYRMLREKLKYS